MEDSKNSLAIKPESMLEYLLSLQLQKLDADLTVDDGNRQGVIHVREGVVVSAHSGILDGNGAILTIVQMDQPQVQFLQNTAPIQKTVYFTLPQIARFLSVQKKQPNMVATCDEEALLREAKLLFFQFSYKLAIEKLVTILRYNRFFYPAWLWQSRILTRHDYISKALDEAYRWGNHDQDVWRESRKIRPQLDSVSESAKRCIFCWSILSQANYCEHCKAFLNITGQPHAFDLKQDEIQLALRLFEQAFKNDTTNARTAYSLALGYFNIKEYQQALSFLRLAVKLSPQSMLYKKSLSLLLTIARTHFDSAQQAEIKHATSKPESLTILMIEDSQTSRKVLSMLFDRLKYHVLEASTGAEAIIVATQNRPDLILLDIMLPDINGHDLLPKLREIGHMRNIPVIMLTGKHDFKDRMLGIQAGVDEYVTKPFNPQKMTALVQQYLQKSNTTDSKKPTAIVRETPQAKVKVRPQNSVSPFRETPPATRPDPAVVPEAKKNGRKSIFVIEDSRTSRKVLSMILGRNGFDIYEATTGLEAIQLAQTIEPDLVLLDVMLPDMTGYNVLPQLKQVPHFEKLPVIMLTGKRGASDRMQGMLAGSNEYLTKPFNPQKLLSVINGYI